MPSTRIVRRWSSPERLPCAAGALPNGACSGPPTRSCVPVSNSTGAGSSACSPTASFRVISRLTPPRKSCCMRFTWKRRASFSTRWIRRADMRDDPLDNLSKQLSDWEQNEVAGFLRKQPERKTEFRTFGGLPAKRTYTALDVQETPLEDIGLPGRYPFTRGPYPTMYRSRLWTMRQIAGFGTAI